MSFFIRCVILLIVSVSLYSSPKSVTVVRVIDGDSMHVQMSDGHELSIRLFGIDAPELAQSHGESSREYLNEFVKESKIEVQLLSKDTYGRSLAMVYDTRGRNLNLLMIQMGYAWVYRQYHSDPKWLSIESDARSRRLGLWFDGSPIPPWIYRRSSTDDQRFGQYQ